MIKRIKRIDTKNGFARKIQAKVSSMRHISNTERKTYKVCGKCSYPFCENVETKLSEFQVCGKCKRTKYCNIWHEKFNSKKKFLLRLKKLPDKTLESRTQERLSQRLSEIARLLSSINFYFVPTLKSEKLQWWSQLLIVLEFMKMSAECYLHLQTKSWHENLQISVTRFVWAFSYCKNLI